MQSGLAEIGSHRCVAVFSQGRPWRLVLIRDLGVFVLLDPIDEGAQMDATVFGQGFDGLQYMRVEALTRHLKRHALPSQQRCSDAKSLLRTVAEDCGLPIDAGG